MNIFAAWWIVLMDAPGRDALNMEMLSVVIPCFNEEAVISETVNRFKRLASDLVDLNVEFIFVDDGSTDATAKILKNFAGEDSRIKLICLARNFGHQIAVTAGVDASRGDAVVLIDADLQDPPEAIHEMIGLWRDGYEVVYGTRVERPSESQFKLITASFFYRLLRRLSDVSMPMNTGDFRLMDRVVVDALRAMPERDRFVRGLVSWVGFRQTSLPYKRSERYAGKSKYHLFKMLRLAIDGILSFSSKPLQISIGLGLVSAIMAIMGMVYAILVRVFTDNWVEGWAAIMVAVLFVGGIQLISVGVLGEYVGRIYGEIKRRPLYVVSEYRGFDESPPLMTRSPVVRFTKRDVDGL